MKKGILFLLLVSAFSADAQSLKDLLYNGKLKTDSGGVIRKDDDLKSKIDTSTRKKPVEPEKTKMTVATKDASMPGVTSPTDATTTNSSPKDNATVTKDNNKLWKEFVRDHTLFQQSQWQPCARRSLACQKFARPV